jgi:hypothetical protein
MYNSDANLGSHYQNNAIWASPTVFLSEKAYKWKNYFIEHFKNKIYIYLNRKFLIKCVKGIDDCDSHISHWFAKCILGFCEIHFIF